GIAGAHNLTATIAQPGSITETVPVTITFGAAHHLNINAGATGATSRVAFTGQPVIEVLDISGNRVGDSTASVAVSATGANGAVLGGDLSMNAVGGIAYFAQNANGLKLSGAVGSYTLTYASTGLTAATETIALTHGVATQIVLTQSAAGAKSGQAFTTQPSLQVRDADGNLVDTGAAASAEIKVSVSSDAYDAAGHTGVNLTGSAGSDVATAANGVATFANLRLEGVVASAYRLNFAVQNTVGYNGIATNQNIALTAGTSTQLRVLQQPAAIVAGVAFASAVKVEILDAWNNRVLDAPSSITVKPTLVADSGASTVVDSSKSAVANSSGLVTFTGLTFTKAGTQYIEFTSTGLTSVVSDSFVITNAEADHLAWVTSPVGAKNDYAVKGAGSSDPELEVRDAFENPVLTGAATSVSVAVQPANTDVLAISGASATSDSSARIKFSNLVLRAKVGSYTLRFRAANGSLPINGTHLDSLAPVAISFGDPTALNLTRSAAGANSGVPFTTQPRLNIEDSAGNVVADSTLAVTISETETQVLSGTVTRAAVAGSVDFTDSGAMFTGAAANGLTLKYAVTYNGSEISTTQSINLTAGAAVALTIGQQPTDVRTRDAFSPVPTVVLRDAAGNRVYSDSTSTVTAQLLDASGSPVGNPTAAFTAASGLVTFAGLSFTAPSTDGYSITYKLTS
ncbi:MAG: beta strand repeat-containing protein, partial [Rhodoluna sp.]